MKRQQWYRDGEVHKDIYIEQSIYEQELNDIFSSCWQFICHESQIPKSGDYFTSTIAKQPIVIIRKNSGEIKALHNRCPHKGVKILATENGNTGRFLRCPYHAWTFKTSGELLSIPVKREYDPSISSKCESVDGIKSIPNLVNYRGFIFIRMNNEGMSFDEFFGDSLSTIDNMVDRSPEQELKVVGKPLRHIHKCNWKMVMDNQTDTCHPMVAHESSAGEAIKLWENNNDLVNKPMAVELFSPFMSSHKFFSEMGIKVWPNGHGYTGVNNSIHKDYTSIPGYFDAMASRYGKSEAESILNDNRHNTVYFPNLVVKGPIQTLRIVHPISAQETVVESWVFELVGAPKGLLERTVQYNNLINSPCSMVAHDDVEMYERATEGLKSTASNWINITRLYSHDEDLTKPLVSSGTSEIAMRNFYKTWNDLMEKGNA